PVYREPVYAPEDDALYLADWKRVARVPAGARGGASWAFAYPEDGDLPSRIEALPNRPAVAGGLVYATLHRNRPATVLVGEDEQRTVERRSDWRVVALGREGGEKVWDAADAEGFARWSQGAEWLSPPLYAHGSLFVVALLQETDLECYLLRIDAHSGELVYAAFVASRARRDYLGLTTAPPPPSWTHDGRVLINPGLGVVACVAPADGDLEWIAHYGTPPPTSVPVLWERQRRFAPQAPLARTTPWIVAPADGSEALAFDPDGRRVWAAPRGQARYAVADAERVYLVGDALAVHERAHGRLLQVSASDPRLRPSAPPALLGEELVLSTQTELVRRDLASGEVLGRYAYAAPRDELGAPVVLDRAHLATVGSSRVNVYRSFEALSEAVRRESLGVERELRLGVAQVQAGDAAGLERLRRVLADRRTDREQRVRARRAAFVYAEARAWEAERRGEFEARAREALELAWDGPLAQATPPQGTEAQRLAQRSARLLVAWAERRAESPDPAAGAEAAAAFQCLLWLPHSSRVEVPCGIEVDPWGFGEARLRQLVAARGRGIYATQEALARQELQLARSTDDTAQLERLLERFGAAACAADARWELATRYLQRALREEGVATLERFLREWPEDPRVPEAWARLATNYLKLGRRAEARRALRTLMTLSPEPQVKGGQRVALPARAWASPQLAELEEGRDARVLLAEEHLVGLHPALKPWLRTRTELDAEPRGLADVLAFPARPDLVVTQRDQEVELLDTATGQATALYVEEESSLLELGFAGETLVVPTRSAVHGFLLPPGEGIAPRGRWTWAPEAGEASAPAPGEPLDRRGELVYEVRPVGARIVVRISGEVVVLDAADGRELGRIVLPRVQRITARDGVLYALSGGPVEVAAYALDALGAPRWSWTSDERELSGVTWLGSEQLVVLQSGLTLTSLRVDGGSRAWEVESPDDWFLGMQPSPNGKRLLVRTQSGGERGFVILGELGQELWTDRGRAEDGARAALNLTEVGEDAVFSWRTVSGAGELWAQDLERGTLLWRYKPAGGGAQAPDRLLLTPELVAFGLRSAFSQRVDLSVLGRGTGDLQQALRVPGRRLVGAGVAALAGRVWVSTDRGLSAFAHLERTSQAERVARLGARVSTHPDDLDSRRELARALVQGGDTRAAVQVLEATLQAEGLGDEAGQSLLDELAALVEADTDDHPQTLPIRRQARPPEIDGELHDWWRPWSGATLLQPSHVQPIQQPAGAPRGRWRGDEDLSGRLYLSYDDTYLYFALDVSDAVLRPYDTESDAWIGDALLIAIDCKGDGGEFVHDDDMLLSLALTLPKKKKEGEEEEDAEEEEEDDSPAGQYFVRRKEDNSGVIYECAIPWASFRENGVSETDLDPQTGPRPGFRFGFDVIVTDDDGARGPDGPLGALKTLQLAPGVLLHRDKSRLWQGYVPRRFTRLLIQ
ncbi:MAG: sugar-binding protein, partial [Planctomycetota bacterium]